MRRPLPCASLLMLGRADALLSRPLSNYRPYGLLQCHMRYRLVLIAAALLALVLTAPASAKYRVGLGEQNPTMFDQPAWQSMKLKRVRYLVPWDYAKHAGQAAEVNHFMSVARAYRQDVLVTFTARRGCYSAKGRYSKKKACRAPSTTKYKKA